MKQTPLNRRIYFRAAPTRSANHAIKQDTYVCISRSFLPFRLTDIPSNQFYITNLASAASIKPAT